jgi:uncharacterized membrane protein YeiH
MSASHLFLDPIFLLEFLATIAFAISGVLSAFRKRMDVVGVSVCAFLAAFGGGTLRDVLLDRRPFFWVDHQMVLLAVLAVSLGCAALVSLQRLEKGERGLQIPDAIGLGLFCATGTHLSWTLGQPPVVAVMMGVITATFGGVLRDLVCNEIPALFRDHRPYALCAVAGGSIYLIAVAFDISSWSAMTLCALTTTGLRSAVLFFDLTLPAIGKHRQ